MAFKPTEMFVDAQEMAIKYPTTFQAPDSVDLENIHPGDYVKVCALRERFWVEVSKVDGDLIEGRVDNDLVCSDEHGLVCDQMIQFEKRHVYSITLSDDEPSVIH